MDEISKLMERAKNPSTLEADGNYTIPRSFGVYHIAADGNVGHRYRFGNHPVRMNELLRDFGDCESVALFIDRNDAKQLAIELNK